MNVIKFWSYWEDNHVNDGKEYKVVLSVSNTLLNQIFGLFGHLCKGFTRTYLKRSLCRTNSLVPLQIRDREMHYVAVSHNGPKIET